MTEKKESLESFELQARQAARAVHWLVKLLLFAPLGTILLLTGFGFAELSSRWIGGPIMALGIASWCYALWFAFVGRNRALVCPNCGCRGQMTEHEWAYHFHCPNCASSESADVGLPHENCAPPAS